MGQLADAVGAPGLVPQHAHGRFAATLGDVFTKAQLAGKRTTNIDLQVFVKPLVNLIWVAGFVFVVGALIAMWPDAVEQRRLAARYAAGAAPAGI